MGNFLRGAVIRLGSIATDIGGQISAYVGGGPGPRSHGAPGHSPHAPQTPQRTFAPAPNQQRPAPQAQYQQYGAGQQQYQQPATRRSWRGGAPRGDAAPRGEQFEAIALIFMLGTIIALSPVVYLLFVAFGPGGSGKEHLPQLMNTLFTVSVLAGFLYVLAMLALTLIFSALGSPGPRVVQPVKAPKPVQAPKASNGKPTAKTGANVAANPATYGAVGIGAHAGVANMGASGEPPARPMGDEQTLPYAGPIAGPDGSDMEDDGRPIDEPEPAPRPAPFVPAPPVPAINTYAVTDTATEWRDPDQYERERTEHPHFHAEWETLGSRWSIAAVSSRGTAHRNGKYRDDDFAIRLFQQRTPSASSRFPKMLPGSKPAQSDGAPYAALIAIADGLGSREFSRRGARAATQGAVSVSEDHVRELCALLEQGAPLERLHVRGRETLRVAFDAAARAVEKRAKDDRLSVELLHSTLIIILAIPHPKNADQMILITSQVGDGAVYTVDWTAQAPHVQWNWLLKPQVESTGTQVTPFMTRYEGDPERLLTEMAPIQPEPLTCLLAMTDGAADSLIPYNPDAEGGDFAYIQPFYADVCAILRESAQQKASERAVAYRRRMVEVFNTKLGSDDDITLVCLFHNRLLDTPKAGG